MQQALEANSEAIHALEPVIDGRVKSPEETMRRISQAVKNIYAGILNLTEVMTIPGGEQ